MNKLWAILYVLAIAVAIVASVWWIQYKYHDCLRVGHSKTYCLMDQFFG